MENRYLPIYHKNTSSPCPQRLEGAPSLRGEWAVKLILYITYLLLPVISNPIVCEIRKCEKRKEIILIIFKVDDERGVVRRGRGFSLPWPEVYFDMFDFLQ